MKEIIVLIWDQVFDTQRYVKCTKEEAKDIVSRFHDRVEQGKVYVEVRELGKYLDL